MLRHRDFRNLFIGQSLSTFGDRIVFVALALYVTEIGTPSDVGLVLAAHALPLVGLILLGGVLADRISRTRVMIGSDIARCALHALLAALIFTGAVEIWHIVVIEALYGCAEAFFKPAQTGLLPQTVPEEEIQQARAASGTIETVAEFAGPALATALVLGLGAGWAFAIDAATFLVSIAFLLRVRPRERGVAVAAQTVLADLRDGWRAFRASDWLWGEVSVMSLWNATFAIFRVVGPVVAIRPALWATVLTATGIGAVIGGLVLVRVRPRRPGILLSAGLLCSCGPALALAAGLPTAVVAAAAVLAGAGSIGFNATWESTVQREVPRESLSRVMAYDMFGSFALAPVGYALGGLLVAPLGARPTLYAAGFLLAALAALLWTIPGIRRLRAPV